MEVVGDWAGNEGIAPLIEFDDLRHQLVAQATSSAGGPADAQRPAHHVAVRASAPSFIHAVPDSGFRFEIDDRGPDRVRVEFETGEDARVRVEATCVDGVPDFVAEVDSD